MLSALTGIQTDTIVNYTVTKHFNERACIEQLIETLSYKDTVPKEALKKERCSFALTVILDRGYYSKNIFVLFHSKNVGCVMRIKRDANIIARKFFNSKKTDLKTSFILDGKPIPIRLQARLQSLFLISVHV